MSAHPLAACLLAAGLSVQPHAPQPAEAPPRGSIREVLAAAAPRALAGEPKPPRREDPGSRKRSFLRSPRGVLIVVVAGSLIVGAAARAALADD